jgi:Rad3-related DNA helicase
LILADARLTQKFYGKAFLDALPSRNIQVMTINEIAQAIS